jgi:hypothetical protein
VSLFFLFSPKIKSNCRADLLKRSESFHRPNGIEIPSSSTSYISSKFCSDQSTDDALLIDNKPKEKLKKYTVGQEVLARFYGESSLRLISVFFS